MRVSGPLRGSPFWVQGAGQSPSKKIASAIEEFFRVIPNVSDMMIWLIIVGALVLHESAHVLAGQFFGGHWMGIRIRWTRLAVIIQIPEGTPSVRFPIALAGLIVDSGFWLGFVLRALIGSMSHAVAFGLIWFSLILALNATPLDPWQRRVAHSANERE